MWSHDLDADVAMGFNGGFNVPRLTGTRKLIIQAAECHSAMFFFVMAVICSLGPGTGLGLQIAL